MKRQKPDQKLLEYEALINPLMDRLFVTAYNMAGNCIDAEDLVQETCLRAWRSFHTFTPGSNFRAWIFRILRNNYINDYNYMKRLPTRVDFDVVTALHADDSNENTYVEKPDFEDKLYDYFDDPIQRALQRLPEQYRVPLLMSTVAQLSYEEMAKVLDCPIGTIMSRISRGRKMMARHLRKYATTYGYAVAETDTI